MRLKEVKWTLWVKEELGACCRQRAQSERELGRQMRLLLTASTEHLMARDGGPQPLSSMPLVSHFIAFSRAPPSAFANMSSHHSYFTVISIVSPFLFCFGCVVFLFSFQGKFFVSALFCCSDLENRAWHWCLGDWVVLVFFFREGVYVFFMMWYTAQEREHWVRTYQCQATFSAWYEDENDMRISGPLLPFCQYLRLLM